MKAADERRDSKLDEIFRHVPPRAAAQAQIEQP
jgi:hypothetical protein